METPQTVLSSHSEKLPSQIITFGKVSWESRRPVRSWENFATYLIHVFPLRFFILYRQVLQIVMWWCYAVWFADQSKLTFSTSTFKMSFIFTATVSGSYPCVWSFPKIIFKTTPGRANRLAVWCRWTQRALQALDLLSWYSFLLDPLIQKIFKKKTSKFQFGFSTIFVFIFFNVQNWK